MYLTRGSVLCPLLPSPSSVPDFILVSIRKQYFGINCSELFILSSGCSQAYFLLMSGLCLREGRPQENKSHVSALFIWHSEMLRRDNTLRDVSESQKLGFKHKEANLSYK